MSRVEPTPILIGHCIGYIHSGPWTSWNNSWHCSLNSVLHKKKESVRIIIVVDTLTLTGTSLRCVFPAVLVVYQTIATLVIRKYHGIAVSAIATAKLLLSNLLSYPPQHHSSSTWCMMSYFENCLHYS